ncbi:MAG: hypothetical protein JO372_16005 [Solirubrobacterales bacterium]|nr:hypothetical protein [Solirubrobacterales bacterium]
MPAEIVPPAIPRTPTGKNLEVPVKRMLQGLSLEEAAALGAADDPDAALRSYDELARAGAAAGAGQ